MLLALAGSLLCANTPVPIDSAAGVPDVPMHTGCLAQDDCVLVVQARAGLQHLCPSNFQQKFLLY